MEYQECKFCGFLFPLSSYTCKKCKRPVPQDSSDCGQCGRMLMETKLIFNKSYCDVCYPKLIAETVLSTTDHIPQREIKRVIRIRSAEIITEIKSLTQFQGSYEEPWKNTPDLYKSEFTIARQALIYDLKFQVCDCGGNAAIGCSFSTVPLGNGYYLVFSTGTAVELEPSKEAVVT